MRLLDLFCGGGGAAMGYHRAGFDVVGVDINPQPNYPFEFWQMDAVTLLDEWDGSLPFRAIHASPPRQAFTAYRRKGHGVGDNYPNLIPQIRTLLEATGLPYVIENVPGARRAMVDPVQVCGTSLGCYDDETELRRHRLFESNWWAVGTPCRHNPDRRPVGVYGHLTNADRPNRPVDGPTGPHGWKAGKARARKLMGIDWEVTDHDVGEAIPPRYTQHIGEQLMAHLRGEG
jgi:DNA (cytosine-5)-methyltransferase 1